MLRPCWEIKQCGRERGGKRAAELGVCPAYPDHGHSCWRTAGTFCPGAVEGTFADKLGFCTRCEVFRLYAPDVGEMEGAFRRQYPEEYASGREATQEGELAHLFRMLTPKRRRPH
jgi:hypothetical protein